MLHIRTLGAGAITIGDRSLAADQQPLAFALLLLLATLTRPVSRREVAVLFWPAATDIDRNHRLRSLLHRLRCFGASLVCSATSLSLTDAVLDFREFSTPPRSLNDVRSRLVAIGPVLPVLRTASPALADRLDDIRDAIVATMTRWLDAASALARSAGDWSLVGEVGRAAREVDLENESAWLAVAEAECLTGQPRTALATIDGWIARSDGGDQLDSTVVALRDRIHRMIAEDGTSAAREQPCVGREEVMRRIWNSFARAKAGHGSGLLCWGPAGIGKTRVLDEIGRMRVTDDGCLIRVGARPVHALRPMMLLIDLAERLLAVPGAAGCDPIAYSTLVRRAAPNDHRPMTAVPPSDEPFVEALVELLAAISDETPLLVAVDDLHFVDAGIWRWLRALVRWSADRRLLWLFTYRALLEGDLRDLPEPSVIQRIFVGPLDPTAARALLSGADDASPLRDDEQLLEAAGPHPVLLQTFARTGGRVPPELEWLLDDWLARLPGRSLRALRLIASLGDEASPGTLANLLHVGGAELGAILGELERVGMIRETEGVLRSYTVWASAALSALGQGEHLPITLLTTR